jgi:hypothetical protein
MGKGKALGRTSAEAGWHATVIGVGWFSRFPTGPLFWSSVRERMAVEIETFYNLRKVCVLECLGSGAVKNTNNGTAYKVVPGTPTNFFGLLLQQETQKSHFSFHTHKNNSLSQ